MRRRVRGLMHLRLLDKDTRKELFELLDQDEVSGESGQRWQLLRLLTAPDEGDEDDGANDGANDGGHDYFHFFVTSRLDYKFYWSMYYVLLGLLCGAIIAGIERLPFVDSLFIAAAAMTGAGLSTVGMNRLSTGTFQILATLMIIGCAPFMMLVLLVARRVGFARAIAKVQRRREAKALPPEHELTDGETQVIRDCQLMDEALGVLVYVTLGYVLCVVGLGIVVVYAGLRTRPMQEELRQRRFSFLDNASFLAVSAFANAGMALASDSLVGLSDNPSAYVPLSLLILAGNSALPIFLRSFVAAILHVESTVVARWSPHDAQGGSGPRQESGRARYRRALQFILDHPRRLTPFVFSSVQTKVLGVVVCMLVLVQYFFFLVSTLNRLTALQDHSRWTLAGIGYFQTLAVRAAGFTIMDLRQLNQGLIFIYAVMMYMSSFPFVATLEKSANADASRPPAPQRQTARPVVPQRPPSVALQTAATINPLHLADEAAGRRAEGAEDIKAAHINKKFLSHFLLRHSFFLVAAVLVCAYAEDGMLTDPQAQANLWYVIFEIVSAYGNVGLSLGVPGQVYSLSGAMSSTGKAVMIAMMWLGKHRGLPSAKDEVVDFGWDRYLVACRFYDDDEASAADAPRDSQGSTIDDHRAR
eukprot:gene9857-7058_t